ncbi:hypothetical protein ZWY2020_057394 [Hordeum vulgare]|uniref:Bifunctional inhibitor/plant lipid transfer protein/seed storage helical domain-containing protein n=1 Tax=Hordeum vulgare subsp. vulgare TaxID=112509 RepID=A0A8I6ZEF9_HORVV|nr:hypothetical protein ZWY2020_001189 [Hordeum vulgare]KAI4992509.1 hypothetical protein ZWY2020_057394 [Hordeum vulgare]
MTSVKAIGVFCFLVFVSLSSYPHHAQADHCAVDKSKVMRDCWRNIGKNVGEHPLLHGSVCCQVIRAATDIHCVCDKFTAHELARISLAKFAMATHVCGNGLRAHTHCAGYTVPVITLPAPPPPEST